MRGLRHPHIRPDSNSAMADPCSSVYAKELSSHKLCMTAGLTVASQGTTDKDISSSNTIAGHPILAKPGCEAGSLPPILQYVALDFDLGRP